VVFCVQHLAGRLYSSLAEKLEATLESQDNSFSSLKTLVSHHAVNLSEIDENSMDVERSYLSIAGLLSGCVKSMGVHTYRGRCFKRKAFDIEAIEKAEQAQQHVLNKLKQRRQSSNASRPPDQQLPPGWSWVWSKSQSKFYIMDPTGKGYWRLPSNVG
jgi:hypothetical protein